MQQLQLIETDFCTSRDHLSLTLHTEFLATSEADVLLQHLIHTTDWQQPKLKVYGKWHPTPRLISFHGHQGLDYKYSNTLHKTQAWTPLLNDLRQGIEARSGARYNAVLLNYYRDGQDTMGWHADDEPELGGQPTIASLSIGAARDIHFKPKLRWRVN